MKYGWHSCCPALVWDVSFSISMLSVKRGQYFNNYRRSFRLGRDAEANWSSAKIETNSVTKATTCSEKHTRIISKYFHCLPTSPSSTVFLKFPSKDVLEPFLCEPDGHVMVFDGAGKEKHFFGGLTFKTFLTASKESVKELIYQKKNGNLKASKWVISMQSIEASTNFMCWTMIYPIICSVCSCSSWFCVLRRFCVLRLKNIKWLLFLIKFSTSLAATYTAK